MKSPIVEQEPTYFAVYYSFELIGVFSAYQIRESFTDWEYVHYWAYQV